MLVEELPSITWLEAKMKSKILIIFLFLMALGCGQANTNTSSLNPRHSDPDIKVEFVPDEKVISSGLPLPGVYRKEILSDLRINKLDGYSDLEITEFAREYVYSENVWPEGSSSDVNVTADYYPEYLLWKEGVQKYMCGGSSYTLAWILEELGIPARGVQLATINFIEGLTDFETHVTTEVYIDGEWIIQDATFNTAFECDGVLVGIQKLAECIEGEVVEVLGEDQSNHTLETYPIPFLDHLAGRSFNNSYSSRLLYQEIPDYPFPGWDQ